MVIDNRYLSRIQQPRRAGKAGTALAVGVFLLSFVVVLPMLRWRTEGERQNDQPSEYTFAEGALDSATKPEHIVEPKIKTWHHLPDFEQPLAQFESVFWEPRDTDSLRVWIGSSDSVSDATVLEIGTGTGLIALWCAEHGARRVVATDINQAAAANARYNAQQIGVQDVVEVRLVPSTDPGAFSVVEPEEQFDLIISNPPWEDAPVSEDAAFALYDPGFALLDDILAESKNHLKPGGKLLLAYGAKEAIRRIIDTAPEYGWNVNVVDERTINELRSVFLPGVLLELSR